MYEANGITHRPGIFFFLERVAHSASAARVLARVRAGSCDARVECTLRAEGAIRDSCRDCLLLRA